MRTAELSPGKGRKLVTRRVGNRQAAYPRALSSLEHDSQTDLRSPRSGAIRTGCVRARSRIVGSLFQDCSDQIVLGRAAACVIRRVEQIESLNCQVANHSFAEGQL